MELPALSVVMASYLGDYPNAATGRIGKFARAIKSFVDQDYPGMLELVIVSDGCQETERSFAKTIADLGAPFPPLREDEKERVWDPLILDVAPNRQFVFVQMHKQSDFSGEIRNAGIRAAKAPIIAYLDTDDIFVTTHTRNIIEQFGSYDWVFYNDYVAQSPVLFGSYDSTDKISTLERGVHPAHGAIGTSAIAHKRTMGDEWSDGYGHDWKFVEDLMATSKNYGKIKNAGYVVCHVPGVCDL